MSKRVLVTGARGFIAHHLIRALVDQGNWVRGVDIEDPEFEPTAANEFELLDLRAFHNCLIATRDVEEVYHLAADMGGINYIQSHRAQIARNDTMINVHMIEAARVNGIKRFYYSSSACIYPHHLQLTPDVKPLKEDDAWPAAPEEGYGLEKIFMEKLCEYYRNDYGLETRVVRFHNVYGPKGAYDGGKDKAPMAISRKVALLNDGDEIEIWGDGMQTRSFIYIDDCIEGILRHMRSDFHKPLNLGRDELITVDELVDMVSDIAGKKLVKRHDLTKPQGVRGRNCDNSLVRQVLNWEPSITMREGLSKTYPWVKAELEKAGRIPPKK